MNKLTRLLKSLLLFARKTSEIWLVPISIVLYMYSPKLIRSIDPTAAVFDAGVLQVIILLPVILFSIVGVSLALLALRFPTFFNYLDNMNQDDLLCVNQETRLKYSLLAFFGLFAACLIIVVCLLS